jgi:hypothetical protein
MKKNKGGHKHEKWEFRILRHIIYLFAKRFIYFSYTSLRDQIRW